MWDSHIYITTKWWSLYSMCSEIAWFLLETSPETLSMHPQLLLKSCIHFSRLTQNPPVGTVITPGHM